MENARHATKSIMAIVLCAGKGKRMGDLTKQVPKPLLTPAILEGAPILGQAIKNLQRIKVKDIIVVTGYLGNAIKRFVRDLNCDIEVVDSRDYEKGPLNSFVSALRSEKFKSLNRTNHENSMIIVIPGDTIFEEALFDELLCNLESTFEKQKQPIVFYRTLSFAQVMEKLKPSSFPLVLSIAALKPDDDGERRLDKIEQVSLVQQPVPENHYNQVIPMFAFPISCVGQIIDIQALLTERSIRALINQLVSIGSEISAVKIDAGLEFHDIDLSEDLDFSR